MKRALPLLILLLLTFVGAAFSQENCFNGIDDDGDGLIDLNDDECICEGFGGSSNVSSLIPNSSFEDRSCCPNGYSDLGCADTWIQASNPTSDYWNTCGSSGSGADGGASLPPPDGNGFVGFIHMSGWQEYVGACLTEPMQAGQTYDLSFFMGYTNNSPALDLTFYGTPNCGDLPFGGNDCPVGQGGWVQLGQVTVGGPLGWEPITATFTPSIDINALVLGGSCGSGGGRTYYYMDDLSLVSTEEFEVLDVFQSGQYCDNNIVLNALTDTFGGTWQWYKEGVALIGETTQNYSVEPGAAGIANYTVTYTIGSQCEAIDIEVEEPDFPTAQFSTSNVCFPEDVVFTDESSVASGAITNWNWDFGDGNTSTQSNPTHAYAADGTYTVELEVTTDINCIETYEMDVTVYPKPSTAFNPVAGCLGEASTFTDQTSIDAPGNIAQYAWDFGDGNTSNLQNPTHNYAALNTYDVKLVTTSNDGCLDSTIATIDVYPRPAIDISVTAECTLDAVQFNNNSSITSGTIDQYDWDFGDNTTSSVSDPTHVYSLPNTYTVELVATSNQSCVSDTTFELISYPNPVANFTATNVCADAPVELVDNSSVVAPGILDTWEVDMGDASAIQTSIPAQYQYNNPGSYTIELILTTQHGCDDTLEVETTVYDIPVADFSFTNICEDDSAQFNDLSIIASGAISNWLWDFGNGSSSTSSTPSHQTYSADAVYPVSLIVSSGFGCADTLEDNIEVYPVPIANFTFDSVCFPLEIQFTDLSDPNGSYDITSWQWSFSDNQTSAVQNPIIDFFMPGTFSAELLISNGPGCKNTHADGDAVVHPLPEANFPSGLATCLEDTIWFVDESIIIPITDDEINTWTWNLNDGTTITTQNGSRIYENSDLYNVTLTVETNHACTDDVTKVVEIYPLPSVDFSSSPYEGCAPLQVQFQDQTSIPSPYVLSSWEWTFGIDSAGASNPNPGHLYNPELEPLDIGSYNVSLIVTSGNGCVSGIFRPNYITVYPKPDALFSVDEDVKSVLKPEFIFTDLSSENVALWDWTFGDGNSAIEQHPIHMYPDTGIYPIVLMVETEYGCLDTIDYEVKVEPIFTFYVPSSFTPNEDRVNDTFFGQGEGYVTYEMHVYDRWGEHIFQSNDDQFHWDGTFKGQQVQQGTYVYYFYLIDWRGHDHQYKGTVTLHR